MYMLMYKLPTLYALCNDYHWRFRTGFPTVSPTETPSLSPTKEPTLADLPVCSAVVVQGTGIYDGIYGLSKPCRNML